MTEPFRWVDPKSDADGFERDVLNSGADVEIPDRARDEVWQALLAELPPGGAMPGDGGGTTAALKAAGLTGAMKGFAVGACAGAVLMGGAAVLSRAPSTDPVVRIESASTSQTKDTEKAAPTSPQEPAQIVEATPMPLRPGPASPSRARTEAEPQPQEAEREAAALAASRLKEEAEMIREARAQLRKGDLARAFALLEVSRVRFPSPALAQEREALTIELLFRSGQRDLAIERARTFVVHFPESPHAASFRRLTGAEQP